MAFERNAPKAAGPGKKAVVLGLCGVALAGLLGYNWLANPPRSAAASVSGDAAVQALLPAGMVEETPAQAIAKLTNDPTAHLLRGTDEMSTALETPPANPFAVAPAWRAELVKSAGGHVATIETTHSTGVAAMPVPASVGPLNLQAIVKEPQASYAILNGHIVVTGMVIDGVKVVEIGSQHIVCQPVGSGAGARFEVGLKGKAKG